MKGFFSNPRANPCSNLSEKSTPSTLNIPSYLVNAFSEKTNVHGSISKYLSHLIRSYRFLISNGLIDPYSKVKTLYQEEGQELVRFDFRPNPRDWAELKCLRFSLNCSMNWIFVYLLELDLLEIPSSLPKEVRARVLPTLKNFQLVVEGIIFTKKLKYDRYLYLRPG